MEDEPTSLKPTSREQALFAEALDYATPERRAAYLDSACREDMTLRRRVEALLRAAENAGDFLEYPPTGLEITTDVNALAIGLNEKPGDRIGRYKLLEQLGEGGCGIVYMAEQEEPVRRRVALKVIKLGMDTRSVVARFEAERQALALMDHPNIAKVLDGGSTRTGRPYFVMELVRGIRITDFCDEMQVSTEARLQLFVQVCRAIQHAHQKGVIHRDLKPSNILVTVNDGVPVPKVIDFGIAKATGQRLTDKTLFTQFHAFIGTPAYISPEQAEMSSVDVDTRSDIFSLGVLLYELLTGRTPFDGEELLKSGLDEMRRTIRHEQPVKPSTRLTQLLAGAEARRRTVRAMAGNLKPGTGAAASHELLHGQQIVHRVRGDLDCIVMKCLEKDRARRYETASALGADIERHLKHEPILARRVNALGRLGRWCRRHPAVAVLSSGVLLLAGLLAVGSMIAAWRVISARHAESAARTKAEAANRELKAANAQLAATVNLLELQRVEELFSVNDSPTGVAHLVALLRRNPSNHVAASRLISALVHRDWALPASPPMRHLDRIMSARFSADGRQVLTASWDKTAKLWDAASGKEIMTFQHDDRVLSANFSADGTRFVTASTDGAARIWNATNGLPLISLNHPRGEITSVEFSPHDVQLLTVCVADYTVRVWDVASGALRKELRDTNSEVVLARFGPKGDTIATASRSGLIQIWEVNTGKAILHLNAHLGPIRSLAFSPDGQSLVSAGEDRVARIWNTTDGEALGRPLMHDNVVDYAAFSPDGRLLLTTSQDSYARLWNATNGQLIGQPMPHEGGVTFGAFSRDGKIVVTTSMDNSARLWEAETGLPIGQPLRQREAVLHASFSPDGRGLVTASWDGTAQVWNIQPHRYRAHGMPHEELVTTVAFDPRGESVLSASTDHTARLWDARTRELLVPIMHHQGPVRSVDYSPDGRRIATASDDGTAQVWDAATGQAVGHPLQHAKAVHSVQFSPDGTRVVTASADGTVRIWETDTGKLALDPLEHGAPVDMARFSPNGRWLVTASDNQSARVWNAQTGQPVTEKLRHLDRVGWAAFSPDGQCVVSGSSDNTARIWVVATGKPLGMPLQHARTVENAVFSPDGHRIATASLDRTARIWDATTGEALTPPLKNDQSVGFVCFSPDGRRILTSCWNGTARLWDSETGSPLTEWLDAGGPGLSACFDPTGERIAAGSSGSSVRIWDVPPAPTPVPIWFLAFAQAVAGESLTARGHLELTSRLELQTSALPTARAGEDGFYERLVRWFLADPAQRSISPF